MLFLFLVSAQAIQLSSDCSGSDEYFDTTLLDCQPCDPLVGTSDDFSCTCAADSAKTDETRDEPVFECEVCPAGSAPTSDLYQCLACESGVCTCSAASLEVSKERELSGDYASQKSCLACSDIKYYPGPTATTCEMCPDPNMTRLDTRDYECSCDTNYTTAANICIQDDQLLDINSLYPLVQARRVIYPALDTGSGVSTFEVSASSTFEYFYTQSAWACREYGDLAGCQVLANLCVLQTYNEDTTVCKLYQDITANSTLATGTPQDSGRVENMPWLYYGRSAKEVIYSDVVQMQTTFDPDDTDKIHNLVFYLAKFSLEGVFLGNETLTDQLILCPHSSDDSSNYRKFGTNVEITCKVELDAYLSEDRTVFYELFLEDSDGSLIDIPILIKEFLDEDGDSPNEGSQSGWRLVRRFFIYDNLSGIEGATDQFLNNATTSVLTYPKSIALRISLRTDEDEKINVPLLIISYRSRTADYLGENNEDNVKFASQYTMNTERFWQVALGLLIFTNLLAIVVFAVRFYVFYKTNLVNRPLEILGPGSGRVSIKMFAETWSFIHFWYLLGLTGYWFVFYKMQYHVFVLIPPSSITTLDYVRFYIFFAFLLFVHSISLLLILLHQSKVELMLVDWEQPKKIPKLGPELIAHVRDNNEDFGSFEEEIPVSAWRVVFVANEFNELQTTRYINIEFTLIFTILFLYGIYWIQLGTAQPNMDVGTEHSSPMNPVLRFFLTSFLLLVIGYTQVVLKKITSVWFPTDVQNFVDSLAVSNISVFILDEMLHGYYLHGKSPMGKADVPLDQLLKALELEGQDNYKNRGLTREEPDLQTYEIFLTWRFRKMFDALKTDPVYLSISQKTRAINATRYDIEKEKQDRINLGKKIGIYIDMMTDNIRVYQKSPMQRFLGMPPATMGELDGAPFLYKNVGYEFENVFLAGRDFTILLFDILIFQLFDLSTGNVFIAALCTYIISKAVSFFRKKLGEGNVANQTLVDKKFLL